MVSVSEEHVQWHHLWGSSREICCVLPMSVWGRGHLGNSRAAMLSMFHCFFAALDFILSMRWWGLNTGGVVIGFLWRDLTRMRKPSEPLAMRKSRAHWEESPGKWEQSMSSGITKQSIHNFKKNFETIASIMSPLQTQQSTGSDEIRYAKARDTSEKKMHLSRNGLQGWRHTSFSSFSLFATSSLSLSSSTACWTSWPNP